MTTIRWALLALIAASAVWLGMNFRADSPESTNSMVKTKPYYSEKDKHKDGFAERQDEPEAFAQMWEARREGTGEVSPASLNLDVLQALARAPSGGFVPTWGFEERGPGNFGGRSRAIVIDPNDVDRMLFSSVSGGVWRTEDRGLSWTPVGDFIANLAIGSMILDPDDPTRVFAGTGEGFFNGDAARGAGILVSTDFGTTWAQLPSTDTPDFYYVNRLAMVPGTDIIVAATQTGLWRSTDLGVSWTQVAAGFVVDNRGYVDVKTDPGTPQRLLAMHFGSAGGRGPIPEIDVDGLPTIIGVQMGFGPQTPEAALTAPMILGNDGSGTVTDGCEAFPAGFFSGRIALVDRGNCAFTQKVTNAEAAGAVYVVIAQNLPDPPFGSSGTGVFAISAMMVSLADGNLLKDAINGINPGVVFIDGFEDATTGGSVAATVSGPQFLTNYLARSTDGGATWTQLTAAQGLPESDIGRGEIGWGPGGVAYTAFANVAAATRGLWRSADGGLNWAQTASATAFIERQGWYDLVVAVSPTDSNRVYMGAVDQFVTSDGGATITKNTFWNPAAGQIQNYIHADHHFYTFQPGDSDTLISASDGGVQFTTNAGATYSELNFGLNAAMPNNISVSPNGRVITGTQDNGSHLDFGSADLVSIEWNGGDGGNTAADQQDSNFFYSSQPNGTFFGTADGGATVANFVLAVPGTAANSLFYAPIGIDVNDGNRLALGVAGVQFTANARALAGATFTQIVMPASFGTSTNSITISPVDGTVAFAGSTNGAIARISGLGTTNTVASIQGNLPLGNDVSQIMVDPADGDHLYVVLADYGADRVWETTDGGTTWASLHGTLADVPMFSIVQVPGTAGDLLVGSEIGLWYGLRSGTTGPVMWERFSYGIPNTRVPGMAIHNGDVYFAVYGRSNFKATLTPLRVSVHELRNDIGCDTDGYLDVGETADLPVTVRNLSNLSVGPIDVSLSSSNAGIGVVLPQQIPTLAAGASTTLSYQVTLNSQGACPGSAEFTALAALALHPNATATRTVGVLQDAATLTSIVDGATTTNTLFSATRSLGPDNWVRVTDQGNSGTTSYFASDVGSPSEKFLTSPWVDVTSGSAALSFAIRYDTEGDATQRWDGVVLEARTRSGIDGQPSAWLDIGVNSTVAYDGLLFNNNPLGPSRLAWSGSQLTWRTGMVDLGAFNGSQLQVRFRAVSDQNTANVGTWVDDINLTGISARGIPTCDTVCD